MTIGITGPRRRELWRGAVFALIITGIVGAIGVILLGLTADFLVRSLTCWNSYANGCRGHSSSPAAASSLCLSPGERSAIWSVFLRFLYQVPYGANDPLYDKDIGFYLFSLPAYVVIKNWMLLTLFLSALFAGAAIELVPTGGNRQINGSLENEVHADTATSQEISRVAASVRSIECQPS